MTLILDSGGISALTGQRARLAELRNQGLWPPQIPAVVLAEALTGDARRDFHTNRLLRACQIRDVDEHTKAILCVFDSSHSCEGRFENKCGLLLESAAGNGSGSVGG